MNYTITEEQIEILKTAHSFFNQVEVKGGGNVGSLYQGLVRLEVVITDILKQKEGDKKGEDKPKEE